MSYGQFIFSLVVIAFLCGCGVSKSLKLSPKFAKPLTQTTAINAPSNHLGTVYGSPGMLPNLTNFTSMSVPFMLLYSEEVIQPDGETPVVTGAIFDSCSFDTLGPYVTYWYVKDFGAVSGGDPSKWPNRPPLSALDEAKRRADARNALVKRLFPQWAGVVQFAESITMKRPVGEFIPPKLSVAAYIAFAKQRANGSFYNDGYVIERDGIDTKGHLPMVACALVRGPQLF